MKRMAIVTSGPVRWTFINGRKYRRHCPTNVVRRSAKVDGKAIQRFLVTKAVGHRRKICCCWNCIRVTVLPGRKLLLSFVDAPRCAFRTASTNFHKMTQIPAQSGHASRHSHRYQLQHPHLHNHHRYYHLSSLPYHGRSARRPPMTGKTSYPYLTTTRHPSLHHPRQLHALAAARHATTSGMPPKVFTCQSPMTLWTAVRLTMGPIRCPSKTQRNTKTTSHHNNCQLHGVQLI